MRIDHRPIGGGRVGPLAAALRDRYLAVTSARVAKYRGWCRPVYEESAVIIAGNGEVDSSPRRPG